MVEYLRDSHGKIRSDKLSGTPLVATQPFGTERVCDVCDTEVVILKQSGLSNKWTQWFLIPTPQPGTFTLCVEGFRNAPLSLAGQLYGYLMAYRKFGRS